MDIDPHLDQKDTSLKLLLLLGLILRGATLRGLVFSLGMFLRNQRRHPVRGFHIQFGDNSKCGLPMIGESLQIEIGLDNSLPRGEPKAHLGSVSGLCGGLLQL